MRFSYILRIESPRSKCRHGVFDLAVLRDHLQRHDPSHVCCFVPRLASVYVSGLLCAGGRIKRLTNQDIKSLVHLDSQPSIGLGEISKYPTDRRPWVTCNPSSFSSCPLRPSCGHSIGQEIPRTHAPSMWYTNIETWGKMRGKRAPIANRSYKHRSVQPDGLYIGLV